MKWGGVIKNKAVIPACAVAFSANFILFCIKLYVGLASNSISIYSDGINNLFDSLSGLLSVVCLWFVLKDAGGFVKTSLNKTEQLLSFVLSVLVSGAGFVFAYSSLERLMYPTPIWFQIKFLTVLAATAVVKLLLFFYFRYQWKKTGSAVVKVLTYDSLLDMFVTLITIMGFAISNYGTYAVDALCGIVISVMIVISAVKMVVSSCRKLINCVDKDKKDAVEKLLQGYGITKENSRIVFSAEDEYKAFLETEKPVGDDMISEIRSDMLQKTGIQLYIVK